MYTMAPEVLKGNYNNKADVWATGVLAYMLLSSQMPFYGRKRKEILDKISRCNYDFKGRRWSTVSNPAKNFISDLLMHDPNDRPSAREARQSLWLNMRLTSSVRTATEADMDAAAVSLENYCAHKTLQKLGLMVIAHKSNSEEIGFLRNVFKRYDKDRNGSIELPEFKRCLSKYKYSDEYMEKLFNGAVSLFFCSNKMHLQGVYALLSKGAYFEFHSFLAAGLGWLWEVEVYRILSRNYRIN